MADVSVPPSQEGALFVATSFYTTPKQTRGVCESKYNKCSSGCKQGMHGTGADMVYLTGECNKTSDACLMSAWCPPEASSKILNKNKHNLTDTGNFSIFFRVDGSFTSFQDEIFSTGDDLLYNYNLFYLSDVAAYSQGVSVLDEANVRL